MAVIKHISIKNSNYNAATDYLTTQHDEFTGKAVLDEHGNRIPREDFILEGIHCDPYSFGEECEETCHVAATNWGARRYMNMDHLFKAEDDLLSDIIAG